MFPLFSFFLITVNSLFLGTALCEGPQQEINIYPEYCFSANKPRLFTLPTVTKNELEWTLWPLIVTHRSIHSLALEKEHLWCLSWTSVMWGAALRWPAGWQCTSHWTKCGNSEESAVFGCSHRPDCLIHNQVTFNESTGTGCIFVWVQTL